VISAYGNLGWVNSFQGNLTEAARNDERAIVLIGRTSSNGEMDLYLVNLAEVLLDKGDVHGAAKQLEKGFEINNETGDKQVAIYLHKARSKLLFAQGKLDEARREAELAIKSCLDVNDEDSAEESRLLLARLDIAEKHSRTAVEALRKALSGFESKRSNRQVEARALLIEALLIAPSDDSKHEVALLAKVAPDTQNASSMLAANLQIARARFALGNRAGAVELLSEVVSKSHRLGFESHWLHARLVRAEIELQSGDSSLGHAQIKQIVKEADARGLVLIVQMAGIVAEEDRPR
jgi:tetratricopeptide (TPR) repeat protein